MSAQQDAIEALGAYLEWCVSPIQDSQFTTSLKEWTETLLDGASGLDDDNDVEVEDDNRPDPVIGSFVSAALQVSVADKESGKIAYTSAEGAIEASLASTLAPTNVSVASPGSTESNVVVARGAVVSWIVSRCQMLPANAMSSALITEINAMKSSPTAAQGLLHSFIIAIIVKNPKNITQSSYSTAVGDLQIAEINKIQPASGGTAPSSEDAAMSGLWTYISDQMEHLTDAQINANIRHWARGILDNAPYLGEAGNGVNAIQQNKRATDEVLSFVSALMNAPATTGAGALFLYSATEGAQERAEAETLSPGSLPGPAAVPTQIVTGAVARAVVASWIANRLEAMQANAMSSSLITELNALGKGQAAAALTHSFVIALMTKNPMTLVQGSYSAAIGQKQITLITDLNQVASGSGGVTV